MEPLPKKEPCVEEIAVEDVQENRYGQDRGAVTPWGQKEVEGHATRVAGEAQ